MVGMIFKPKNNSARHSLSFRNKPTLLPLKTYVMEIDSEEKNKLQELKKKICKAIPLGVPRPK